MSVQHFTVIDHYHFISKVVLMSFLYITVVFNLFATTKLLCKYFLLHYVPQSFIKKLII